MSCQVLCNSMFLTETAIERQKLRPSEQSCEKFPYTVFQCFQLLCSFWHSFSSCRITKPLTFADCVGDELPLGWEVVYDQQVGVYYIDHINSKFCFLVPSLNNIFYTAGIFKTFFSNVWLDRSALEHDSSCYFALIDQM